MSDDDKIFYLRLSLPLCGDYLIGYGHKESCGGRAPIKTSKQIYIIWPNKRLVALSAMTRT